MAIRYRRDVLAGTTLLLAGGAGCLELGESGLEAYDLADREPDCDIFCERTDLVTHAVRSPERLVEFEADEERGYWPPVTGNPHGYPERFLVWGTPFVDELAFADVDGAAEAEAFLRQTTYDEASVLIVQFETNHCQRVDLVDVRWRAGSIYVTLCSQLYGYDVDCEAERTERLTLFIRVPQRLNPDDVETFEVTIEDECGDDRDENGNESADEGGEMSDDDSTATGNETDRSELESSGMVATGDETADRGDDR